MTIWYPAQARLDALNRGEVRLELSLRPGVPTVSAEGAMTLNGFREGVDGRWLTVRVVHEIGGGGYFTEVAAERFTEGG